MQTSAEYIENLCQLFSKFTEPDNAVLEAAENEVGSLIESDPVEFIHNCSAIIMDDGIEKKIVFHAIQNITRSFTPYDVSINVVRKKWMSTDTSIRDYVRKAVFRGIMFEEENITNMASKALCILAMIERNDFFQVLQQIMSLIVDEGTNEFDQEQSERFALSSLYVINEIIAPPYYSDHINDIPDLKDVINRINEQMIDLFQNRAPMKPDKYKEMVISVLNSIILCFPPLYQDDATIQKILPTIISCFESGPNDEIYDLLCKFLYNLVNINYENGDFDFSFVIQLVVDLIMQQKSPANFISAVMFWNCLSDFEFNILQRNIKFLSLLEFKMKYKNSHTQPFKVSFKEPKFFLNLTSRIPSELIDAILSVFTMIDPNDTSSETKDSPEPHFYAATCLINFFKVNSREVFNSVKKFWSEIFSKYNGSEVKEGYNLLLDERVPWTEKHALLLSIPVICGNMENYNRYNVGYYHNEIKEPAENILKNFNYDKDIKNDVISFLTEEVIAPGFRIFHDFILQAIYSPIQRVVDTALYVIKMCVLHYSIGTENENIPNSTFAFLMEGFKKMMDETDYDEIIFQRILYVLSAYFMELGQIKNGYSLIDAYSEEILSIMSIGLSAPQDSYNVFILTNKTIGNFIEYAPIESTDLIYKVLENSVNMLISLMQFDINDMNIIKQQQTLNIISLIFNKLNRTNMDEKKLIETTQIIFHLMEQKNTVFEDALNCLIFIIINLRDKSSQIIDNVLSFVPVALTSESPSIIQMTVATISYLYKKNVIKEMSLGGRVQRRNLPQNLIDSLPKTIELVTSYLDNQSFTKDFYQSLLLNLACLLKKARNYMNVEITEKITKYYFDFIPTTVDENDTESVLCSFESVFAGFDSILKIYSCFDDESQKQFRTTKHLRLIFNETTKNYFTLDDFYGPSLKYYCKFLHSLYKFFGNDANMLLNKTDTFRPIFYACVSSNKKLKDKGNQTIYEITK